MGNFLFFKLLLFTPVIIAIYWFLPRRLQNYWLLLASYGFYISWQWSFAAVLLLCTTVNFVLARELQSTMRGRRVILWAGITFNILLLVTFKYPAAVFNKATLPYARPLLNTVGFTFQHPSDILLPIGLSFTVLQMISYLVDVSQGQVAAADDPVDFALYVVYFPKLLSGPIERARAFLPRLAEPRSLDWARVGQSTQLILTGLFRKLVIANPLFEMRPATLSQTPEGYPAATLVVWLLAYSFALYNDFAGYTDLMRGISGLLGIELSPNFQQPYFARSFTEFWNRWHITLSHWLRDYIYFPLSRALLRRHPGRRNLANLILPPLVTMFVSACWHGVGLSMFLWGALHGIYQVIERIPTLWKPITPPQNWPWWRQALARIMVFGLVVMAWIPFAHPLPVALAYVQGLGNWTAGFVDARVLIIAALSYAIDSLQYHHGEMVFLRWPRPVKSAVTAVAILAIMLALRSESLPPTFVYQGF